MKIKVSAGFRGWCLALLALSCIIQQPAEATPTSGTFYWTNYGASNAYGYGSFSWDGASLSAGTTQLALLPGLSVDGSLAIGSDGNIYSGRAGGVSQINPSTGAVVSVVSGVNSNATSIDPTRMTLYVGWKGVTPLATLPTGNSFGPGTVHPLSGDNTNATGLAWDGNGTVWYTTGGEDVLGDVGTIDLATFTTTRRLSAISATAITFDPFTGAIFTAGINGIAQINPATGTVVSTWLNPQGTGLFIQNLAATGTGHLIALDSNGLLRIWDFSSGSGLIGGPGTIEASTSTQVTDGGMALATLPFGPPVIVSPLAVTGTVAQPFVYQFETSGATSLNVTNLPQGLVFDTTLAAITGIPGAAGTFQVGLSASNSLGTTNATLTITVQTVPAGPVIVSGTCATGRTGHPFSFQLQTKGGSSATRFAVDSLPSGFTLDPVTGFISGIPNSDGSFSVAVTAIDGAATTNATLQLTFTSNPTVPIITSAASAILIPGQPFTYTMTADANGIFGYIGTDGIVHQAPSPSCAGLPAGLCFDGINKISGTYNPPFGHEGGFERVPSLSGGIVTNVQLFATDPSGTGTFPLIGFIATPGTVQISTRLTVGTGDNVLIGGFIIVGNGTTRVLIRAIGPSLAPGVPNVLADPILDLRDGGGSLLGSNDNWEDSQSYAIRDTQIPPINNLESAILAFLSPGAYTATVRGKNNTTGNALVEVYDLGIAAFEPRGDARLANISTRGTVLTGDNVIIGGFFVRPEAPATSTRVVVRAIGPSLPVPGALGDPTLELHDGNGGLIDANDNWRSDHEAEIIATTIPPSNDLESAIVRNLTAGPYTAIVQGSGGTTGVALVEVYALQ